MAKGTPGKPKGKMSAYAYFVQTCREEHKKKSPEIPVNFAEFSKKCSGRWKVRIEYNRIDLYCPSENAID
uniref:High mobility group protein B3 n=1 Tax=Salmo salar TaxID=8030 RepID=B9EMN6_SALSA|nr:High mobility group protein B3 [Salmo salar]